VKIKMANIDSFTNVSYNNYRLLGQPSQTTSNAKYNAKFLGNVRK